MKNLSRIYFFDDFQFDAERLALYHKENLVKVGDRKTMQVLAVLLQNPKKLTAHDEIIEQVWQDNPHGVTSAHIGQYISKLRKIFAEFASEKSYVETVKGRGYLFIADVFQKETTTNQSIETRTFSESMPDEKADSARVFPKFALGAAALILISLAAFGAWTWVSEGGDEEKIRQVVKESQIYESLVLYKNPTAFQEEHFDKYWTTEFAAESNYDRRRIRDSVKKLIEEGKHYGDETKNEVFEFQSIEIDRKNEMAVVKTLEKWFIAVYFSDGTLQRNKTVGPYFVSYIVRKVNGRWLIEKSTTARVNRPTPRLTDIAVVSEIKAGEQFFVRLTGQDFEAETVYLEVVGAGCPESQPCKVPNSALREKSKLSEIVLDNVPLTLASGDFRITVRNGDSQTSNPINLKVP